MNVDIDVAVVGGGPAGLAAALTLRRHFGLSVAVIEKTNYELARVGETLSPGAQTLLEYLGAWESFAAAAHLPANGTAAAWGSGAVQTRDFMLTPFGTGWHLDRRRFDHDLAALAASTGVRLRLGAKLRALARRSDGRWLLALDSSSDSERLSASFLVDATGRLSIIARRHGVARHALDRAVAVIATAELAPGATAETVTLVEACEYGWWYSAPVPQARMIVGVISDPDLARARRLAAAEEFTRAARDQPHTAARIAAAHSIGLPQLVAAYSSQLSSVVGDAWLAVGDAAASHDPLSSSGVVRALDTGIRAAHAIRAHLTTGTTEALDAYQTGLRASFDVYRLTRDGYYAVEGRWPDSPFWNRRRRAVTLDPRTKLCLPTSTTGDAPERPTGALEAALIRDAGEGPRAAYELVAAAVANSGATTTTDLEAILTLQTLLRHGHLERSGELADQAHPPRPRQPDPGSGHQHA